MKELASLNKYFVKYIWHLLGGIAFVTISNYFRILQPQMLRYALDLLAGYPRDIASKKLLSALSECSKH